MGSLRFCSTSVKLKDVFIFKMKVSVEKVLILKWQKIGMVLSEQFERCQKA